mgnify:CR=1 FL=1|jgi:hypothetical protein|tara:strand:- start:275 stop:712 length:438 start_codon:yes stop_codon:yes gene_type:complete
MNQALVKSIKYFFWAILSVAVLYLGKCSYEIYDALRPENMCGKTLGYESMSPSGSHKAVIYEFNCGAMDPFSTQISILAPNEEVPYSGGNVFGSSRGERRGDWNGPYAEIEWLSENHLHIKYIKDTNVHHLAAKVNGVKITSETL